MSDPAPEKVPIGPHVPVAEYEATHYVTHDGDSEIVARVGQLNPELDALLTRHGATRGAFITAWNPRSETRTQSENDDTNAELRELLDSSGHRHLPHIGRSPDGQWEEHGYLVLDLPLESARELAERFGQYAIMVAALGQSGRLVFTTHATNPETTAI